MNKLVIISGAYSANSASSNRLLALLHGFDECGVEVEAYFVRAGSNHERIEDKFKSVTIKYLWEKKDFGIGLGGTFKAMWCVYQLVKTFPAGTIVLQLDSDRYLPLIVADKRLKVYHERTEHPSIVRTVPNIWYRKYLRSCKKLAGMFVISEPLKKYYESLGCKNIHIINMFADERRFKGLSKESVSPKYIAYCGNGSNNKDGVDDLIRAFAIVVQKYPDIQLRIIGPAPTGNTPDDNLCLVRQLGIEASVEFTGMVPASQIPQLLKNAEILALARPDSLQAQCGFPTKLGEYLLSGNPVVVTSVGDIPKFLKHKESVMITEQRDIRGFAESLMWLLEHPTEAASIGAKGQEVAQNNFNYIIEARKIKAIMFDDKV